MKRLLGSGRVRLLGLVLILAVLVIFTVSSMASVTSGDPYPRQVTFDGWSYTLGIDPAGLHSAEVSYSHSTVEQLRLYTQVNVALAHELAANGETDLSVSVSFRRPLSVDEFSTWAARMPIQIDDYRCRVIGRDGRAWTLGGRPSGGQVVSEPDLKRTLAIMAPAGASTFDGVVTLNGRIPISAYDQLAGDQLVFLADVTKSAVKAHIRKTMRDVDTTRLVVRAPSAYADMYDLGLENFR